MEGTKINSNFFLWWYKDSCTGLVVFLKRLQVYLFDLFSVKNCFTTLFAPWKRDYINTEGLSLQDRFQVLLLNMSSRFVGMVIKLSTIFTYAVISLLVFILSFVLAIVWVFYPVLIISLIIYGFGVIVS